MCLMRVDVGLDVSDRLAKRRRFGFCRQRAMKLRSDAEELQATETKEALIALARNYDMMATELEQVWDLEQGHRRV